MKPWPIHRLPTLLGIEASPVSHRERWLSMAGGVLGIALVFAAAALHPLGAGSALVVASMGASAVLVFGVPHGALSQPWPVLGGHLISACVGVTMAKLVGPQVFAGPIAVGVAILAMHYARCLHPPGGATALAAVIGGNEILALGYGYLVAPVLVNVALLLLVGVLFNYPFQWRRYPVALARAEADAKAAGSKPAHPAAGMTPGFGRADLIYALSRIDSFIDVSEEDLVRIYDLAAWHAGETQPASQEIRPGRCYSNGRFGPDWAVRCIVDESDDPRQDLVIYRGVAGADRRSSGMMSRGEFARWARHEVERDENTWRRVTRQGSESG